MSLSFRALAILIGSSFLFTACGTNFSEGSLVQASADADVALASNASEPPSPGNEPALANETANESSKEKLGVLEATTCSWKPTLPAYFVDATNGLDTNSGSEALPFKTLAKAVDSLLKTTTKRIYLRRGTHTVTSTLVLDSRSNGGLITSYPCEWAIIDGGRKLTAWKNLGNQLYSIDVNDATSFTDLTAWGKRLRPATSAAFDPAVPDMSGWHKTGGGFKNDDGTHILTKFQFRANDLVAADLSNLTGIVAQSFSWDRQRDSWTPLASIDWPTRTIFLDGEMKDRVEDSGTFRLLNNYRWIRISGEFSWNWTPNTKTLYIKHSDPAFMNNTVLPIVDTLVKVSGATDLRLFNMTFQNSTSSGAAIDIENSKGIKIGGNTFQLVGTAIRGTNTSSSSVASNTIEQTGYDAINFTSGIKNNKIYANKIKDIGQIYKMGSGIALQGASDNIVSNNDISNVSHYGISHKDFGPTSTNWRNRIEYNKVYNVCVETGDCGAIETLGRTGNDSGVIIKDNYVEKYNGLGGYPMIRGFKGFGIYVDDRSSGMTIEGNFIKNDIFSWAQIFVHGGDNNVIVNNFSVAKDSKTNFVRIEQVFDGYFPDGSRKYRAPKNNQFIQNVIYYAQPTPDYSTWVFGGTVTVDRNLLYNTSRYSENLLTLDAKSAIATQSPFNDADAGLYRLRPNSEAIALGIRDFRWHRLGAANWVSSPELPRFW